MPLVIANCRCGKKYGPKFDPITTTTDLLGRPVRVWDEEITLGWCPACATAPYHNPLMSKVKDWPEMEVG